MSIEQDMILLMEQIRRPIVFYFPMRLYQHLDTKQIDQLKKLGIINSLMVFDTKDQPHFIEQDIKQVELLKKEKILKSNVLKLIDIKGNYEKESFEYLFTEYGKELDAWVATTAYIKENAKNETENYIPGIQDWLELQHYVLKQHQEELKKRIGDWSEPLELNRILKMTSTKLVSTKLTNLQTEPYTDQSKSPRTKKKKDIRPSVEKVDQFLLKVHFNVDFSKIHTD